MCNKFILILSSSKIFANRPISKAALLILLEIHPYAKLSHNKEAYDNYIKLGLLWSGDAETLKSQTESQNSWSTSCFGVKGISFVVRNPAPGVRPSCKIQLPSRVIMQTRIRRVRSGFGDHWSRISIILLAHPNPARIRNGNPVRISSPSQSPAYCAVSC